MTQHKSSLFLSGLSTTVRESLLSHSTSVDLPLHKVLYETEIAPRNIYILTHGLASVVTPMPGGEMVEVGFIGREGVVGSLQLLGPALASTRCMMQLAGSGVKISFAVFQKTFDTSEEVHARVLEFVQMQSVMVGQIAGCNRLHSAEQRLARWLLMAQDRTQADTLKFTQEYLSEMIGTQRTTVTVIAGLLQDRGLIGYARGTVRILNRKALERVACSCYAITQRLYENLYQREAVAVA